MPCSSGCVRAPRPIAEAYLSSLGWLKRQILKLAGKSTYRASVGCATVLSPEPVLHSPTPRGGRSHGNAKAGRSLVWPPLVEASSSQRRTGRMDAEGGNRTHTPRGEPDFESGASASSATSARSHGTRPVCELRLAAGGRSGRAGGPLRPCMRRETGVPDAARTAGVAILRYWRIRPHQGLRGAEQLPVGLRHR